MNILRVVLGELELGRLRLVYAPAANQFRVRAVGPGGLSEGTATTIASLLRRRAARP